MYPFICDYDYIECIETIQLFIFSFPTMISNAILCTIIIVLGIQCFTPFWSTEEIYKANFEICKNSKLPNTESVEGYLKSPSQCANKCNLQYFCNGVNIRNIQEGMYSCELHRDDSRLIPDCTNGSIVSKTRIDCYIKRKIYHFYNSFVLYGFSFFKECQRFYSNWFVWVRNQ